MLSGASCSTSAVDGKLSLVLITPLHLEKHVWRARRQTTRERERSFPEGRRKDEAARSSRVEPTWQGGRSCEGAKRPFQYGILVPTARGAALPHLTGERWSRTSQARGHFNAGRQREWSTLHLLCLCEVAAQPSSQIHPPARCED